MTVEDNLIRSFSEVIAQIADRFCHEYSAERICFLGFVACTTGKQTLKLAQNDRNISENNSKVVLIIHDPELKTGKQGSFGIKCPIHESNVLELNLFITPDKPENIIYKEINGKTFISHNLLETYGRVIDNLNNGVTLIRS